MTLVSYNRSLEPQSVTEALSVAERFARVGFCGVKSADEALIRILAGRDFGLGVVASMGAIYVVHGRPGLSAVLMHALALQSPNCERFECVAESATSVTYAVKRKGGVEQRVTWDMQRAQRAGLAGGDNWRKYPEAMLHARARAEAARRVFPDVLLNYQGVEELQDLPQAGALVVEVAQVSAPPPAPQSAPEAEYVTRFEELAHDVNTCAPEERLTVAKAIKQAIEAGEISQAQREELLKIYALRFPKGGPRKAAPAAPPAESSGSLDEAVGG